MSLAEALRQKAVAGVAVEAGPDHPVNLSIGAAKVVKGGNAAAIYRTSDAALYRAKRAGRNRGEAA